ACPSQYSCPGTDVNCHERRLASVPAEIPTTTKILRLYINQITKLEPGVFDTIDLTRLTVLDLSGNQLQALPEGVFDRLVNLQKLWLNSNQLTSLPAGGAFDRLGNLQELYMCCNKFTELPRGIDKLTQLRRLSLNQNQLKSIPDTELDSPPPRSFGKAITLTWDCACSDILYLSHWANGHADIVQRMSLTTCSGTNDP
uniref:LRRNT domain-containing protein n=2 Tax=Petromyzon marinus TaxID=7757 RepID=S4RKH2_PETMA